MDEVSTAKGLRAWARGLYSHEAAIELLVRAFGGRFAAATWPWIVTVDDADGPRVWLDAEALEAPVTGVLSSGERRVLSVVRSLAGGEPVALDDAVSGLDRRNVALVLAAIAHAAGTHEHCDAVEDRRSGVIVWGPVGSLFPWPASAAAARSAR